MFEVRRSIQREKKKGKGMSVVDRKVCRKTQGYAEEGNSCLTTPGTCESCPDWAMAPAWERPPRARIDDILKNRRWNIEHFHMRYAARRDYLQLCAEIDHLRIELEEATRRQ